MLLVLVRSRPGNHAAEQPIAAASWPCVAGSASTIASSSADAVARSLSPLGVVPRRVGAVGGVTHAVDGRRAPAPAGSPTWASGSPTRSGRGCRTRRGTRSKPAANSAEPGSSRDSAHIAWLGSAESTSPIPAMIGMIRSGRPTAVATALMTPTGTVAMYVVNRWWANILRCSGSISQEPIPQLLDRSAPRDRAGRRAAPSCRLDRR